MLWSKGVVATHHPICLGDVCSKHVPTMPLVNRVTVLSEDRQGPARRVCAGVPTYVFVESWRVQCTGKQAVPVPSSGCCGVVR